MLDEVEKMLLRNFGAPNPAVLRAVREVPREYFMYDYEADRNLGPSAYELPAREWKIGYGSVLTDFVMQAYMTAKARPRPTDISLEVGTGSGYQSSLLSRIVKRAYTIEIITALGDKVQRIFSPLGLDNIESRVGDGFFWWPAEKGRTYDHPHRPAVEAPVPLYLHQGRAGQGAFAARRVDAVHPHDGSHPDPAPEAREQMR